MRVFSTAAAALLVSASFAQAATFDFGQLAIDRGEGAFDAPYTVDDITLESVIAATHDGLTNESVEVVGNAYLDEPSGGLNGGLGACTTSTWDGSGDCPNSDDDNVGPSGGLGDGQVDGIFEAIALQFSTLVTITDIVFRDDDHRELSAGELLYGTAGADGPEDLMVWDIANMPELGFSSTWIFASASNTVDFYVDSMTVSEVPLPAAGWLLLGGLGGLAAMKRRKKAA